MTDVMLRLRHFKMLVVYSKLNMYRPRRPFIVDLFFTLFVASLVWEYVRLYQIEVAKKTAIVVAGLPPECRPNMASWWHSFKKLVRTACFWSRDPCEEYYKAALVNPFWEVSPIKVFISLFIHCLSPLESIGDIAGRVIKGFFLHIPLMWQLTFIFLGFVLIVLLLLFFCGYRVYVPCLFTLTPPVRQHQQTRRIKPHTSNALCRRK